MSAATPAKSLLEDGLVDPEDVEDVLGSGPLDASGEPSNILLFTGK